MPKTADFTRELAAQIVRAERQGRSSLEVNAGELHRTVGGYPPKPGENHSMPMCCQAMWNAFDPELDSEVDVPPSRKGASLTLRYQLPRRG